MCNKNIIKDSFVKYCGDNHDKFMSKLQANEEGVIKLFFWQEKLVESFLIAHPEFKIKTNDLLDIIKTGQELVYKCPICKNDLQGDVICIDRKTDTWGCCECGEIWHSKQELTKQINQSN